MYKRICLVVALGLLLTGCINVAQRLADNQRRTNALRGSSNLSADYQETVRRVSMARSSGDRLELATELSALSGYQRQLGDIEAAGTSVREAVATLRPGPLNREEGLQLRHAFHAAAMYIRETARPELAPALADEIETSPIRGKAEIVMSVAAVLVDLDLSLAKQIAARAEAAWPAELAGLNELTSFVDVEDAKFYIQSYEWMRDLVKNGLRLATEDSDQRMAGMLREWAEVAGVPLPEQFSFSISLRRREQVLLRVAARRQRYRLAASLNSLLLLKDDFDAARLWAGRIGDDERSMEADVTRGGKKVVEWDTVGDRRLALTDWLALGRHPAAGTTERLEQAIFRPGRYLLMTLGQVEGLAKTFRAGQNPLAARLLDLLLRTPAFNRRIDNAFGYSSERQKLLFVQKNVLPSVNALLATQVPLASNERVATAERLLEWVASYKGIVFDAVAGTTARVQRLSGDGKSALVLEWKHLRGQLAAGGDAAKLTERLEAVERQLGKDVVGAANFASVTRAQLAGQLAAGDALVDYVLVEDEVPAQRREDIVTNRTYVAVVLGADGAAHAVDLGPAAAIDTLVQTARERLQAEGRVRGFRAKRLLAKGSANEALQQLYQAVWAPIAGHLGKPTRALVATDAALSLVPFAALLGPKGPLIEDLELGFLTSGRSLMAHTVAANSGAVVAVANPAFGPTGEAGRLSFEPLPATEREAAALTSLFKPKILSGAAATEQAVQAIERPRVLHLATHGFFLPAGTEKRPLLSAMTRSGLALAGANTGTDGDGYLTAFEVTSMDLRGTELVTLSACETGVGKVVTGEGVFGLRRAFGLAGAKNLMMSLWPVADEETSELMVDFYKAFAAGERPSAALRKAQLATIAQLTKKHGRAHPALWAAFFVQVAGSQRPVAVPAVP